MSRDSDFENSNEESHRATIDRWRKKRYAQEDAFEAAVKGMKEVLADGFRSKEIKRQLAVEAQDHWNKITSGQISNQIIIRNSEGHNVFNDPDAVISPEGIQTVTGYNARPWENEDYYEKDEE